MRARPARWRRRRLGVAASCAVAASAAALLTGPAAPAAAAGCTLRSTAQYLSRFGDLNHYFVPPGGGFEWGDTTWRRGGAAYSSVLDEPWSVLGGTSSVALPAGASVTSPTLCIATAEDSLRFFVRLPGLSTSRLHVHVDVTSGVNRATSDVDVTGERRPDSLLGWWLADRVMLPDIRDAAGVQYVTVTLTSAGTPATWYVDDLLVDPWKIR